MARSNGNHVPETESWAPTGGSQQPFLSDTQRAALDAALAAKMTTLTTGIATHPLTHEYHRCNAFNSTSCIEPLLTLMLNGTNLLLCRVQPPAIQQTVALVSSHEHH